MTRAARAVMEASTAAVVLTASCHEGATSLPASPTCTKRQSVTTADTTR